jgi:hypothetical protein
LASQVRLNSSAAVRAYNLANVRKHLSKLDDSAAKYRQMLAINSNLAEAQSILATHWLSLAGSMKLSSLTLKPSRLESIPKMNYNSVMR